jgi:hypothetical protein
MHVIGHGRYAREAYPERARLDGAGLPLASGTLGVTIDADSSFETTGFSNAFVSWVGLDIAYTGSPLLVLGAGPNNSTLTYVGAPTRDALIILVTAVYPNTETAERQIGAGIAKNGDLLGLNVYGTPQSIAGVSANNIGGNPSVAAINASTETTSSRRVSLVTGDTIQPVMAKVVGDADLLITNLQMNVLLLP